MNNIISAIILGLFISLGIVEAGEHIQKGLSAQGKTIKTGLTHAAGCELVYKQFDEQMKQAQPKVYPWPENNSN